MAKAENYSAEETAAIVAAYTAVGSDMTDEAIKARDAVIAELADEYGKPVRSIRSKLVNEKVYIAKQAKSKVTGEKPESKEIMAERLAAAVGIVTIGDRKVSLNPVSLAKMNKTDIAVLFHIFNTEIVEDSEIDADENDSQEDES